MKILTSTSVPFRPTTVQMPNLALIETKQITVWDKRLGTNLKAMLKIAKNQPWNNLRISTTSQCTSPATTPLTWPTTTWSRRFVRMRSFGTCLVIMSRQSYKVHFFIFTLQRHNTENSKKIFSEKELRGLNPNFHIRVFVSDLFIPTISLPVLLQKICGSILGVYK